MGEDAGKLRARGSRVRAALPVVAVETREDWAVLLAKHNRLLRDYARHYLGDAAPEEDVEDTVERTLDVLLAVEDPAFDHALRYATQAVWRESQRTSRRRELERTPVDRRLGPLTGRVARVLEQLGPRQRQTLILAAQGLSPSDIARVDKSTAAAVRVRLYRARERMSELLQEGGVSAFLLFVPRRVKRVALRGGHVVARVADGVGGQAFATGALVPVFACAVLGSTAAPAAVAVARQPATIMAAPAHGAVAAAVTAAPGEAPSGGEQALASAERSSPAAHQTGPAPSVPALSSIVPGLPFDVRITLPDAQLFALAEPPRLQGIGPIVAAGYGRQCGLCSLLFQSLDRGRTWTSRPLQATETGFSELALPPNYPTDPRIFASSPASLGTPSFMAPSFDQPFQVLATVPPGHITTSAHFDDGDPRLFSVGLTALWSTRLDGDIVTAPHLEIDYSYGVTRTLNAFVTAKTPPPSPAAPAVVAWVPAFATVPTKPRAPTLAASSLANCPVSGPCVLGADLPVVPTALVISRTTVFALSGFDAYVSRDFGLTASVLDVPVGRSDLLLDASETLPNSTLWARVQRANGTRTLLHATAAGKWAEVADPAVRTLGAVPNTYDDRHIWTTLDDGQVRCALVAGGPWLPLCPP